MDIETSANFASMFSTMSRSLSKFFKVSAGFLFLSLILSPHQKPDCPVNTEDNNSSSHHKTDNPDQQFQNILKHLTKLLSCGIIF